LAQNFKYFENNKKRDQISVQKIFRKHSKHSHLIGPIYCATTLQKGRIIGQKNISQAFRTFTINWPNILCNNLTKGKDNWAKNYFAIIPNIHN